MYKVGQFEKVSFKEFDESLQKFMVEQQYDLVLNGISTYNNLKLPTRATKGSAGYDFYLPISIKLSPNETIKIPTGIKVKIDEGWLLVCFPRSGLGFKYRLQLDNTVAIIDSDYYNSDNEGHIFVKITNDSKDSRTLLLSCNDRFVQGIFLPYGITYDDNTETIRNGGIGSTSL